MMKLEGGSAFGELSSALANSSKSVDYVVPVTDNGGSSGEIRRVFGGSAVGDIRSRLMHVAPIEKSCYHLRNMLQTRLDPYNESKAMFQMKEFCSAHADDWKSMTENERIILVLLSIFIKMATAYDSTNSSDVWFQFRSSNFGNLVLHSLKFVLGGLEEAIRWFSFALLVPETTRVFPCTLDLEQTGIELGAELEDGQIILGQDEISHPPVEEGGVLSVDKNLFGGSDRAPPSKICKMFYSLSTTGERIKPSANLNILPVLETAELILYGPGSLFTSVMPSLILPGMGEAVASSKAQKLLLLNGNSDRESGNMTALEYLSPVTAPTDLTFRRFAQAIASGFNRYGECEHDLSAYLNYV
uniref:Uncharacterized protein n=1 Tax=Guillardia theta (strain CCMP2712) TaxID=905079 RepID=A0A0C3UGE4_GUITC